MHEKKFINLNTKKSHCHDAMSAKILQQFFESYLPIITETVNESITDGNFLSGLKQAQITPVFKKLDCMNKENYKRVSLLSICPRYLKEFFTINLMILWKINSAIFLIMIIITTTIIIILTTIIINRIGIIITPSYWNTRLTSGGE